MGRCRSLLVLGLLLALPALAAAENGRGQEGADGPNYATSVTLSPLHLLLPVVEVTAEHRLLDALSMALIAGAGMSGGYNAVDFGVSARSYPIGSFVHGVQLGLEGTITSVFGNNRGVSATGKTLSGGVFLGYKMATHVGFTFEVQGGVQYLVVSASSASQSGEVVSLAQDPGLAPLINANLGWSF